MTCKWYIFRTRAGHETRAACESGVLAYVPHVDTQYFDRRARARRVRRSPLLPGYVFLRASHPQTLPLPRRRGYIGFMRNGDLSYAVLSERAYDELRDLEHALANPAPVPVYTPQRGEIVEVIGAAGAGALRALVTEIRGNTVLADVVGGPFRIRADIGGVRAA